MEPLHYREANHADTSALVALINAVYRGDSSRLGWTTEAELLDGQRTDAQEVAELLAAVDSFFLLAEDEQGLLGCAHLRLDGEWAWFGMFAIRPGSQGLGLGRLFMAEAERRVRQRWQVSAMRMSVISLRAELIAYYERRGYRLTGDTLPFPSDPRFGRPKVPSLEFVVLQKPL